MLQTQTVSAVAVKDMTIVRANVIAQRTGSLEIGLAKSLLIKQLKAQSNITAAMTNGRGYNKELVNCIAYFDVIKGNWRSFRFENIYKVF